MNVDVYQIKGSGAYVFVPHGKVPAEVNGLPTGALQFFKTVDLTETGPRIALNRDEAVAQLSSAGWYATGAGFSFVEDSK